MQAMGSIKNRKQIRKEQRKLKKVKRNAYFSKNRLEDFDDKVRLDKNERNTSKKKNRKNISGKNEPTLAPQNEQRFIATETKHLNKLKKQMGKHRSKQLLNANKAEDRNIKRLEKQLKLNKRKSKNVPKSFSTDGLDYLLEVCESETMQSAVRAEKHLLQGNEDFAEDFDLMQRKAKKDKEIVKPKRSEQSDGGDSDEFTDVSVESDNESDEEDFKSDMDDDENIEDGTSNDEGCEGISEQDDGMDNNQFDISTGQEYGNMSEDDKNKNDDIREDIYGRLRDKRGNIIKETTSEKYVPPGLRSKLYNSSTEDVKRIEKMKRLKSQLKGLLNRLAESNMHSISTQMEKLYMANSRNDMNESLTDLLSETLFSVANTPERLLTEHVMLVTILHANVGTEVGAYFLQHTVQLFDEHSNKIPDVENKMLQNIVSVISQLYNFKLLDCRLIYQILKKLAHNFTERNIECLLVVLRQIGFSLRKDDPIALKALIQDLQIRAANVKEDASIDNARVKFMLDILLAIKNNNVSKIPNYDTSYSEHLKKLLKGFIRKGYYVSPLNISLDDLLKADQKGKWWIVGSAWTGNIDNIPRDTNSTEETSNTFSDKFLALAKKQRMNTDTRRSIFCIVMSAEDYLDAFEKLMHLGLKNQQEREIIQVILHCCLQEEAFNAYYAVLCNKFCEYDRKYQMIVKYTVWDKIKALPDCSGGQISNLAKLLTHLFLEKSLSISILKIMHFSELDKVTLRLTRQILLGILLCDDVEKCQDVFTKVAQADKLKIFKESLRLFIHHFLLQNLKSSNMDQRETQLLTERANIVDKLLSMSNKKNLY